MAPDINAEHSFFSIALHVHPEVVFKGVGQGGKATLATAPDADILREIICMLTQRVRAGRATFLIKVKSHRGEPINERADTLRRRDEQFRTTTKVGMIGLIG